MSLSKEQQEGLPEMMEELGLTPENPVDQEPFPEAEGSPVGAIDPLTVTDDHCIYNLMTGCGMTIPLRETDGFEDDLIEQFEDDSFVRIFERLE